jgi:DNA-binding LacI/PurR family transcriptional regulator
VDRAACLRAISGRSRASRHRGSSPSSPRLTLHPDQIGARAAELLIELVEERTPSALHITVLTRLVARAATKRRISATP